MSGNSNASGNQNWSDLSAQQIAQRAFEEATDTYRVDLTNIDPTIVIPVSSGGLQVLGSFNIPFSSISTTAPFVITAGFASIVQMFLVADTTGQTEKISFGSKFVYTQPGCEHEVNAQIPASTPVTIQSQEASNPVAGNFVITFLG